MTNFKLNLIFLSTVSILSLSNSVSFAFTLDLGSTGNSSNRGIGATDNFLSSKIYTYRDGTYIYNGVTTLRSFEKINTGGTLDFQRLLNNGWPSFFNFKKSRDPLPGTIRVTDYVACGPGQVCLGGGESLGVGASIKLSYIPSRDSPALSDNTYFAWIQRAITNHGRLTGHGQSFDNIDVNPAQFGNGTPFYSGAIDKFEFTDRPYRPDPSVSHRWGAELFPVTFTTTLDRLGRNFYDVTLYDGLKWGWDNRITRRENDPNPFCLIRTNSNCTSFYTDVIGGGIGQPIAGYTKNDDQSFGAFNLGYPFTYFDKTYNSLYINNNGNVSFGKPVGAFTAQSLLTNALAPIIAPYWADIDTRARGSVRIRTDIPNQTIITWNNVGYYRQKQDKLASFQLVLRGDNYDVPPGEGNIGFFYKNMGWETGDASGGRNGFGGTPAGVGFGDGSSKVNPGEQMINGSMKAGISQLVSNNHFWFNLKSNPKPPDPCTGGSGGGGCSPKAIAALNSQRTANKSTDYVEMLAPNDLDPTISEIIRSLQNSMLFSPNSPQPSTSSDSWMNELETSSNNSWMDELETSSTNSWTDNFKTSDDRIPFEKSEDDRTKLSAAGISESNISDVPEPTSPLMILVFGLGIAFKKWKLKEHK